MILPPRPRSSALPPKITRLVVLFLCFLAFDRIVAAPVEFNLAAQSAADALIAFSKQAGIDVLFSYDELRNAHSDAVTGTFEPEQALNRLLKTTGYAAHRNEQGKFVITAKKHPPGELQGKLVADDGAPLAGVRVSLPEVRRTVRTGSDGTYLFKKIPEGSYLLVAIQDGYRSLQINHVAVSSGNRSVLNPEIMKKAESLAQLEPYVVESDAARLRPIDRGRVSLVPRLATGNLDLPRTENDPLPYKILQRDQILRSGVVDLNQFLQRELLDSDASTRPPEQSGNQSTFAAGSSNLNLRGFGADETVILVNGRRMPETVDATTGVLGSPDVNFIPLNLVQQVEVLPVSASALYSGNPVGGVINIVLRPDVTGTEITSTYTNALGGYDAAQSSTSLQHGDTLLGGKLKVRVNATYNRSTPPTESELGYLRAHPPTPPALGDPVYRATPNVRSASGDPLFGPGTSSVTSVAPGSDGTGGLTPFLSREGLRNFDLFAPPAGGMAASVDSIDYPYGRNQDRQTYYGSVLYDAFPWLQLGADAIYTRNLVSRGYDVFTADLTLPATSAYNPFGQAVNVSLNETAPNLGSNYSEARLETVSTVFGAVVKLPSDWAVSADAQYSRNVSKYRGTAGADAARWQQLIDQGRYNPLRDTQTSPPPPAFYDEVLTYYGAKGSYVTLGDYDTIDTSLRVTNQALQLPTGRSSFAFGGDYRVSHLANYTQEIRYADGTLAQDPQTFQGRTLERQSIFAELQAPLLPPQWLPHWIQAVETDVALRYISSDLANEANFSPVYGLKVDFPGGFTLRGSFTSASRFPTPQMSRPLLTGGVGPGASMFTIFDPARNNQSYNVLAGDQLNPNLSPEASVTQTAGVLFRRGQVHRVRIALDFADTRKTNELIYLDPQSMIDLEKFYPGRVTRAPLAPSDSQPAGLITSVLSGVVNASWRHSQNWNLSVDYSWTECLGGTLESYARIVYLQSYVRQLLPGSPEVDELRDPDGSANGILKYRANFGAGWNNKDYGFGIDGQYYHSRILPVADWIVQGGDQIKPYTQFDVYLQHDLRRWLPWNSAHYGLRAQLRVNNVFGFDFPKYVKDPSGSGVQPYGDWRKQSYSLSLTLTF